MIHNNAHPEELQDYDDLFRQREIIKQTANDRQYPFHTKPKMTYAQRQARKRKNAEKRASRGLRNGTEETTSEQATTVITNSQMVTSARFLRTPGETKQEAIEEDAADQETLEGIGKRDSPKGDRGPEKRPKRISVKQN